MSRPLVCHLVAGYPDARTSLALMSGLQELKVAALEVQIPFSDPIADGETIMAANDVALRGGMTTAGSFDLIAAARAQGVNTDIYIMSYLQKVRHFGLPAFCRQAAANQVKGLIIPDLPYDSPEFTDLKQLTDRHGLAIVPVVSPDMAPDRLEAILALRPSVIYVTSRRGITGNQYQPADHLRQLVRDIKRSSQETTVMIGFGIATSEDVAQALAAGDLAVVGSALIKNLEAGQLAGALAYVRTLEANQS